MKVERLGELEVGTVGGADVKVVEIDVVVGAGSLVGRDRETDAEVFRAATNTQNVTVEEPGVVAPLVVHLVVHPGCRDLDLATFALEGGARDGVNDAADRIAIAVGGGSFNHLDIAHAIGEELARGETAAVARRGRTKAIDLKRIIFRLHAADVHAVGGAVLVFVDAEAGQAL